MSRTVTAPGEAPSRAPGAPAHRVRRPRRALLPYLLVLPALIAELAIHVIPMLVGAWMSLLHLTQFFIRNWTAAPYGGLTNYRVAVDTNGPVAKDLIHSFLITVAVTVLVVALSWMFGLAAAVFLEKPFRGRGVLRTLFLVPYALPVFTAVITWRFMFQRDNGMVNALLSDELHLAHGHPFWLLGGNSFVAIVVVNVWRLWPFAFLTLMAGLQSIPGDLYEAAAIDGAGFARRLRSVTLPLLRPVNRVLLLVLFLWTFNDFNTAYVLFEQPPADADMISIHIYNASFLTWNFGLGSAMSVLLLAFLLVVTLGYLGAGRLRSRHA
ncbi:carbohydrate ABC transporter permease [Actinoallomurus iriomotensis]|uniref:ABC transporter permease n=1 Tax=Actinoallomurus iriomotensis TaxID=478107 RepID=A0A9W6RPN1_9ACTN|nr:sugar ABC transporter permease [Actinoallomurus iriomotensis]GLY79488.1 ABC transporter permease [Actinoallomurus iriomotensis]